MVERLRGALAQGAQAFWICPLVAESETSDLANAEARAAGLTAAIYLARYHLSIRLFDSGTSRAAWIPCTEAVWYSCDSRGFAGSVRSITATPGPWPE